MKIQHYVLFAALAVAPFVCIAKPTLTLPSPNKKYELVIETIDYEGQKVETFSICDPRGKIIQKLPVTEYVVHGAKWHKSSNAVLVVSHIANGVEVYVIYLEKGVWKGSEVGEFKPFPGNLVLIDAESAESSFECYYLGFGGVHEGRKAYRVRVRTSTGVCTLEEQQQVRDRDLPFYKLGVNEILHQIQTKSASAQDPPHYNSSRDRDEPDWYGVPDSR